MFFPSSKQWYIFKNSGIINFKKLTGWYQQYIKQQGKYRYRHEDIHLSKYCISYS